MLGCRGKVQRASDVIHLVVEHVIDLTADLKTVSGLDAPFPLVSGRGDEARHGGNGTDNSELRPTANPRDIYIRDLQTDGLIVKSRNFR
jgi:error-prone DNA polymerase